MGQIAPSAGSLAINIGHKTGETSESVGGNQVRVTTTFRTFDVTVPVPAHGAGRPNIICPVCQKRLRVVVPSAERRRVWMGLTIGTMVLAVMAGIGILVGAEDFKQGPPFAALVLLVLTEIALINLLVFVDEKEAWILTPNHKPLSEKPIAGPVIPPPVAAPPQPSPTPRPIPVAKPAPPQETWGVAQFTPQPRTRAPAARKIPLTPLLIGLAIVATGVAAYALGRGSDNADPSSGVVVPRDDRGGLVATPEVEPEATFAVPLSYFPINARSNFEVIPGCRAKLTFQWMFDPSEAPPSGAEAPVQVKGPTLAGRHLADYEDGIATLILRPSMKDGGGSWEATILSLDGVDIFDSPIFVSGVGC